MCFEYINLSLPKTFHNKYTTNFNKLYERREEEVVSVSVVVEYDLFWKSNLWLIRSITFFLFLFVKFN